VKVLKCALKGIVRRLDVEIATDIFEARKDNRVEIADQDDTAVNVRESWESVYNLEFGIVSHGEEPADEAETRETHGCQVR